MVLSFLFFFNFCQNLIEVGDLDGARVQPNCFSVNLDRDCSCCCYFCLPDSKIVHSLYSLLDLFFKIQPALGETVASASCLQQRKLVGCQPNHLRQDLHSRYYLPCVLFLNLDEPIIHLLNSFSRVPGSSARSKAGNVQKKH